MRDDGGYGPPDDDDLDAVLVEDDRGELGGTLRRLVFEFALCDPGAAAAFGREAAELGYAVELRAPDDGEGFFEVTCVREAVLTDVDLVRAERELEALAAEAGCLDDEDDERPEAV